MLCLCTVICLGSQLPHLSGKLLYDCKATSPPYLLRLLIHLMFTLFPKLHGSPAGDLSPSLAEALALATRSRRECMDIRSKCQVHPWPTTTAAENNCRSLWDWSSRHAPAWSGVLYISCRLSRHPEQTRQTSAPESICPRGERTFSGRTVLWLSYLWARIAIRVGI